MMVEKATGLKNNLGKCPMRITMPIFSDMNLKMKLQVKLHLVIGLRTDIFLKQEHTHTVLVATVHQNAKTASVVYLENLMRIKMVDAHGLVVLAQLFMDTTVLDKSLLLMQIKISLLYIHTAKICV